VWKESVVNIELHCARVYLAEARRRRGQKFAITLLLWAANARKRAANEPKQRDLFSANVGEA
jgi:hypothetical protein